MGEVGREALRATWSGTLISASSRDYGILLRFWICVAQASACTAALNIAEEHRLKPVPLRPGVDFQPLARWARLVPSLRGTWSGTLSSASPRDSGILALVQFESSRIEQSKLWVEKEVGSPRLNV